MNPLETNTYSNFILMSTGERSTRFSNLKKILQKSNIVFENCSHQFFSRNSNEKEENESAKKLYKARDALNNEMKFQKYWMENHNNEILSLESLKKDLQKVNIFYSGDDLYIARAILISTL